jgi:tripartite-type tricarboxylate transporter receptor subunit TctC
LQDIAKVEIKHVPYRGSAPVALALMGKEIDMAFDATATAVGHIRSGRLRAIAIATRMKIPALPDVPTFAESGLPPFESSISHGLVAPAGTRPAVMDAISKAVISVINQPQFQNMLAGFGAEIVGGSPQQFRSFVAAERTKWASLIKKRGLAVE